VIGTSNVSNGTVAYAGPVSGAVVTDLEGRWQVGGLPVGRYSFTLTYQGCTPVTTRADIVAGRTRLLDLHIDCSAG
jgi:hypothetical protein